MIEVASGEYGHQFVEKMVNSVDSKFPLLPIGPIIRPTIGFEEFELVKEIYKNPWFSQFSTLFRRKMLQILRDKARDFNKEFCLIIQ